MVELLACVLVAFAASFALIVALVRRSRQLAWQQEAALRCIVAESEARAAIESMDSALAALEAGSAPPHRPAPAQTVRALWAAEVKPACAAIRPGRVARARRVTPAAPKSQGSPQKLPFSPQKLSFSSQKLPVPPTQRLTPAPALEAVAFDDEWEVPTVPAKAPRPTESTLSASESYVEPPTRPGGPRRDPFDVATACYPSSLSVARLYARSILSERRASET